MIKLDNYSQTNGGIIASLAMADADLGYGGSSLWQPRNLTKFSQMSLWTSESLLTVTELSK